MSSQGYIGFYDISKWMVDQLSAAGVKTISIGSRAAYSQDKNVVTPGAHISPVAMTVNTNRNNGTQSVNLQLEVFIYGVLTHKNMEAEEAVYGVGNEIDVLDETGYIADRFMRGIGGRTIQINGGYVAVEPAVFNAVMYEGNDDLGGMQGVVNFTVISRNPNC
jgi:hypothetical protein